MAKIKIKALSVNEAYRGRRFKTEKYKAFEEEILYQLKGSEIPDGKLELFIEVGLSSKNADLDNCLKVFTDILQKKYSFNDKRIYRIIAQKVDVPKKEEYIDFDIVAYNKAWTS